MKHHAELLSRITPKDRRPTLEKLTGDTIDLSEYLESDFYYQVWYWETLGGEKSNALPGICLGISHRVGAGMCYWVLNEIVNVISRYMVQNVTKEYLLNSALKETLKLADKKIKEKLSYEKHKLESCPENKFFHKDIILDEGEEQDFETEVPEAVDYTKELLDNFIGENVT